MQNEREKMTKKANCEIKFIEKKIIVAKKFYKAASILNSPEYKELMQLRRDNPTFKMEVREITKATNKKTYRNLTYENMELFIKKSMESVRPLKERWEEYETVRGLSKSQSAPYAYVKAWFLKVYGAEFNKYRKNDEDATADNAA